MADLRFTQEAVSGLLTEIGLHFKGRPRITLVVRNPDSERSPGAQDFIMTDDAIAEAIAALERHTP